MFNWKALSSNDRLRAILVGLAIVLLTLLVITAWTALLPFFFGLIAAYILRPIVNFIDNHWPRFIRERKFSRPMAIVIVYIIVIALLVALVSSFIPLVIDQGETFISSVPDLWKELESLYTYDLDALLQRVPPEIQDVIDQNVQDALGTIASGIQKGLTATVTTVSRTIGFVLGLIIVPFWLFYVLNDQSLIRQGVYRLVPERAREDVACIVKVIDDLLSAYVSGQILLCVIVGSLATIVLLIIGIEYAVLLGTFAGIFEVIPYFGPYMGAIPAILVALVDRPSLAIWVAVSYAASQQIENIFLVPRISGNAVRFHPAWVMVIVLVGSEIGGFLGLLLAVPVAAMLRDVYKYLYLRTTARGTTPQMALEYLRESAR